MGVQKTGANVETFRQQAIERIFDFRFSIVDLIKIRKSQIANPSKFRLYDFTGYLLIAPAP